MEKCVPLERLEKKRLVTLDGYMLAPHMHELTHFNFETNQLAENNPLTLSTTIHTRPSPTQSHPLLRDLLNWMLEWFSKVKDKVIELTMMTLYQSWLARNKARDSMQIDDPEVIAKRSVHLLEEWWNVQSPKATRQPKPRDHWTPPAMGWIKINVDEAMAKNSEKGGGGVVARDHDGRFLAGACHFFPSLQDP
jgi:hypothetical protein